MPAIARNRLRDTDLYHNAPLRKGASSKAEMLRTSREGHFCSQPISKRDALAGVGVGEGGVLALRICNVGKRANDSALTIRVCVQAKAYTRRVCCRTPKPNRAEVLAFVEGAVMQEGYFKAAWSDIKNSPG